MEHIETYIQTLNNRKTILLNDFWKLNIAYIIMAFGLHTMSWIFTDNSKKISSERQIYGWIVGYDKYYDPTDGLYHLNMHGESLDRRTCIYHDYYVGSEPMINILVDKNVRTKMTWTYDPDTKECSEYNDSNNIYGFDNVILVLIGLFIVCFYWQWMVVIFDNRVFINKYWNTTLGYCLTMMGICINIFYPPNDEVMCKYGIKWFGYWFNWCLGIIVNCCLLYLGLKNVTEECVRLNSEIVHLGGGYGSVGNTQCAEFEK